MVRSFALLLALLAALPGCGPAPDPDQRPLPLGWTPDVSALSSSARLDLVAGDPGGAGYSDDIALRARFHDPFDLAYDGAGNLYVADHINHLIRRALTPSGQATTVAGQFGIVGSIDGTRTGAQFNTPTGIALDGTGRLYVADTNNCTIRSIVIATGQVTTVAGTPGQCGYLDGTGTAARFNQPRGLAIDAAGTTLYVVDLANHVIRRMVLATRQVTTLAGAPGVPGAADGIGTAALFNQPSNLALDGTGQLYVSDSSNCTIRRIDIVSAQVSTFAGSAGACTWLDGTGIAARFRHSGSLSVGGGSLYVADYDSHVIRAINLSTTQVSTVAGTPGVCGAADGVGSAALFCNPSDALFVSNTLYVADAGNHVIRRVTLSTRVVATLSGDLPSPGSTDGTGGTARFTSPRGLTSLNNYLYLASSHAIRQIQPATREVKTLAGSSDVLGCVDGTGGNARFRRPFALTSDGTSQLFVADSNNHVIRRIDQINPTLGTGRVTLLAGACGVPDATLREQTVSCANARFYAPRGLAYDRLGNLLYVADSGNQTIRRIALSTCQVSTLSGTPGVFGSTDGALQIALFNNPHSLALEPSGTVLYVSDGGNCTIRRIDLVQGQVTTLAGAAGSCACLDGYGAGARFNAPGQLQLDGQGSLYATDAGNHIMRRIQLDKSNLVSTVAGRCSQAGFRTGTLDQALLNTPWGLTSLGGTFYLSDITENILLSIAGL
jgi:DNA-binding beta-propeller fold protein YncE